MYTYIFTCYCMYIYVRKKIGTYTREYMCIYMYMYNQNSTK